MVTKTEKDALAVGVGMALGSVVAAAAAWYIWRPGPDPRVPPAPGLGVECPVCKAMHDEARSRARGERPDPWAPFDCLG